MNRIQPLLTLQVGQRRYENCHPNCATAAKYHRQQHGQDGAPSLYLMRASKADATKDNVPHSCDDTAT